jgi:hypothetical protein
VRLRDLVLRAGDRCRPRLLPSDGRGQCGRRSGAGIGNRSPDPEGMRRSGGEGLVDPFACRDPDRLRPLRIGEALPYHHHDQPLPGHSDGLQRKDSYPILDLHGRLLIVNPFDFEPFDRFKASGDGYESTTAAEKPISKCSILQNCTGWCGGKSGGRRSRSHRGRAVPAPFG